MSRISAVRWHHTILSAEPSQEQMKLYDAWPNFRGFSDRSLDPAVVEAVIILALRSGKAEDRVLLLAPAEIEGWVLERFESLALRCFEGHRSRENAAEMINGFTRLFRKIVLTGRVLQLQEEPLYWMSFGFCEVDPLPSWMAGRLLKRSE